MRTGYQIGALALAVAMLGNAGASWGATALLSTLDNGVGTISDGNATYSNFRYGGTTLDTTIVVTASTNASGESVLTFTRTAGPWTELDNNSVISFHASFLVPITSTTLNFDGTAFAVPGDPVGTLDAVALVGETVNFDGGPGSLQVYASTIDQTLVLTDTFTFPAAIFSVDVIKSIDIASNGGSGTITTVDNVFTPIPEPTTLGVLGIGALALLARRRLR